MTIRYRVFAIVTLFHVLSGTCIIIIPCNPSPEPEPKLNLTILSLIMVFNAMV
jgi:hypothetical protein